MKAVAFDFDGTLVDSYPLVISSFIEVFKREGIKDCDVKTLDPYWGPNELGSFIKAFGTEEGYKAHQAYIDVYTSWHDRLLNPPDKSLLSFITALKDKGLHVVLLTGRDEETTDISLDRFGIQGLFEKRYHGSKERWNKGENLEKILKDYSIPKDQLLYIGDTCDDINTCREEGIDIITAAYFNTDDIANLKRLNPGKVAKSFAELTSMVNSKLERC